MENEILSNSSTGPELNSDKVIPVAPSVNSSNVEMITEPPRIIGKVIIVVSVILIAVIIAVLAIFFWQRSTKVVPADVTAKINEQKLLEDTKKWTDNLNQIASVDKDFDNLSDVEEKQYGTNVNLPDTDKDGLLDGDEIKIYKTNPLKADTDGDGIKDGREIRSGTDPLKK